MSGVRFLGLEPSSFGRGRRSPVVKHIEGLERPIIEKLLRQYSLTSYPLPSGSTSHIRCVSHTTRFVSRYSADFN